MVKVVVNNTRGLVQSSGNATFIQNQLQTTEGAAFLKEGAAQSGHTGLLIGKGLAQHGTADPYTQGASALWPLGTRMVYGDRQFVYALNGASGITAGLLCQAAVHQGSDHKDMNTTAAVTAGSYTVSLETNGTDLTENQYAGGYLYVNDGTGEGQNWKIRSHAAHDHSEDPTCVFTLFDPVETALGSGTASTVTIHQNKGYKVVVAKHAETSALVGATVIPMDANKYGWLQVSGPAALLTVGTIVVGNIVTRATATANGGVEAMAATSGLATSVGEVMVVNANTEYSLIDMRIGF
jgi:membrane associated rhomboid family serine protease